MGDYEEMMMGRVMLSMMKSVMPELIQKVGYDEADKAMAKIFGDDFEQHKEELWQWYDLEIAPMLDNLRSKKCIQEVDDK